MLHFFEFAYARTSLMKPSSRMSSSLDEKAGRHLKPIP
jgi:hypothetical protein